MELDINLVVNDMEKTLKRKLITSYILVGIISIFLISILANFFLVNQFKDYVIKNQQTRNKEILMSLNNAYTAEKHWNVDVIENVGMDAMQYGMIVSVYDISGKMIWDARKYNNGICEAMIAHMSENMMKYNSNWKGAYVEKSDPMFINSIKVGTVKIGYYGPYYFSDNDLAFLTTLNKIIVVVGIFSLLFALIIGIIMAGAISRPIQRVTKSAKLISKGHYTDRINEKSNIKEINELTGTINNLAENLNAQENLRKKLTGDVAHELRTPLTTLQTHIEAILDGVWEPSAQRITSCHEEIMRINRMVGDLEKVSKYESENFILDKTEFNLMDLVKNVIVNFEGEFLNKNIKVDFHGHDANYYGDKDKLTQVVVNILSNALKYTPDGGNIIVSVNKNSEGIEIIVKDNGIGISDEDLPYIFERFYRADKSRSRQTGGAGIGLTITKSIIDAHKGEIEVKSKINEGTEFKVKL
jgi:two-component system, OmpR family, sensor histidine kinase BaeS